MVANIGKAFLLSLKKHVNVKAVLTVVSMSIKYMEDISYAKKPHQVSARRMLTDCIMSGKQCQKKRTNIVTRDTKYPRVLQPAVIRCRSAWIGFYLCYEISWKSFYSLVIKCLACHRLISIEIKRTESNYKTLCILLILHESKVNWYSYYLHNIRVINIIYIFSTLILMIRLITSTQLIVYFIKCS